MAEFAPVHVLGNDILDIGSRKARRQRDADPMAPLSSMMGTPGQFDIPNVSNPAWYCRNNFASVCGTGDENQDVKFAKGTTTLAFKFQGGVIVSVDSRSTMGAYISSGTVKKGY